MIRHFRSTEWPADGFGDASEAVLSAPLRADRPLWEIVSIAGGPDGRAAVIFRAHHCMLDGMSGMRVLDLLTDAAAPVRARRPRKGTSRRGASEDKQAWGNPFGGTENGAPVWNPECV